ncbi:MAG: MarR family winged helix-turn-helix transcriptional regulator [Thermoplasmata archaeon]
MVGATSRYLDALEELVMEFHRASRTVLLAHELTTVQFLVLHHLRVDGPTGMTEVSRYLGVRPQSVTPVIDSLERRGLVRRTRSKVDRRRTILAPTAAADRLIAEFRASQIRRLERALRGMPDRALEEAAQTLAASRRALASSRPPSR